MSCCQTLALDALEGGNGALGIADPARVVAEVEGAVLRTSKPDRKGIGGANGSPAVYVADGRRARRDGIRRHNQTRSSQTLPPGDAGSDEPSVVTADPQPVQPAPFPPRRWSRRSRAPQRTPWSVELEMHDFNYHPDEFTITPGQKVAVHIVNTGVRLRASP